MLQVLEIYIPKVQTTFEELSFDTYKVSKNLTLTRTSVITLLAMTDRHRRVDSFLLSTELREEKLFSLVSNMTVSSPPAKLIHIPRHQRGTHPCC